MAEQKDKLGHCTQKLQKLTLEIQKQNIELLNIIQEIESQSQKYWIK